MKHLVLIFSTILFISCSVQKRKYQKGFYVDPIAIGWHHKHPQKEKKNSVSPNAATTPEVAEDSHPENKKTGSPDLAASVNNAIDGIGFKQNGWLGSLPEDSCDVIVYKDGSEIKSRVKEITSNEIKYKRCDAVDGPVYISKKSEVFMIKYGNGTREVIKANSQDQSEMVVYNKPSKQSNLRKRRNHPLAIFSMILAIIAAIIGYITLIFIISSFGGLFIVPIIVSAVIALIAVALAYTARKAIKEAPEVYKGKGFTTPAIIISYIVLGIWTIGILLSIL